jgi:hypothetical protein
VNVTAALTDEEKAALLDGRSADLVNRCTNGTVFSSETVTLREYLLIGLIGY